MCPFFSARFCDSRFSKAHSSLPVAVTSSFFTESLERNHANFSSKIIPKITKAVVDCEVIWISNNISSSRKNWSSRYFLEKIFGAEFFWTHRKNLALSFSYANDWSTRGNEKNIHEYVALVQVFDAEFFLKIMFLVQRICAFVKVFVNFFQRFCQKVCLQPLMGLTEPLWNARLGFLRGDFLVKYFDAENWKIVFFAKRSKFLRFQRLSACWISQIEMLQ